MTHHHTFALAVVTAGLLAACPAPAAEAPAGPVGTWTIHMAPPNRPRSESTLTVEKADGKYVGVMTDRER